MTRLDAVPKYVLKRMSEGWMLSEREGRYTLMDNQRNVTKDVNPRTFRLLWQHQLIQIDMTWNHPVVTRYLLHKEFRPHL